MKTILSAGLVLILAASAAPAQSSAAQDDSDIGTSTGSFTSGDKEIAIDRFEPKTKGVHPAILLVHGADGMKQELTKLFYRRVARQAAARGYVAFLVHYYDRIEGSEGDRPGHFRNFLPWRETIGDAIGYIAEQPGVDAKRIGLIGFSLGAFLSLSLAVDDERIGAVVENFGGLPRFARERLQRMPPVLILHGERDKLVSVEEARKLEAVLKEKGLPYEIKLYPEQGHGFRGDDARDALARTFAFLDKHLKPKAAP